MILLRLISTKLIFCLFVLTNLVSFAQQSMYKPHVWTSNDGLPQNSINAIIQDHNGYLVIGTFSGIVKFDGVRFTPFPYKELDYQRVISLYEASENDLWIGTEDNGIFRIKDHEVFHYGIDDGLLSLGVSTITEAPNGNIYFLHQNKGFLEYDGENFRALVNTPFLNNYTLKALFDKKGTMWVASDQGLFYKKEGENNFTLHPDTKPKTGGLSLGFNAQDTLLYISQGEGIFKVNPKGITLSENRPYLDFLNTSLFTIDSEGNYWVSLWRRGLAYESTDGTIEYWNNEINSDFPDEEIVAILQDREGNIWLGTNGGGLVAMQKSFINTLTTKDGLSTDLTLCVAEDDDENLWVGTVGKGINKWDGKAMTSYEPTATAENIWSFASSPKGEYWAGTFGQGIYHFNKTRNNFEKDTSLHTKLILSMVWDTISNSLYVGTEYDGVYQRKNNTWENIIPGDSIQHRILHILPVAENHLWIATLGNGIFEYKNGKLKHYTQKDGLAGIRVRSLYLDADKYLWAGTYGKGLSLYRNNKWYTFTIKTGLYDDLVSSIIEDDYGYLWMSCNKGVYRALRQDLLDVADGKKETIQCRVFTQSHGMSSSETNGGFQPSVWKRKNGQLVFPTVGGVSIFNPEKLITDSPDPIVVIEELTVDNTRIEYPYITNIKPNSQSLSITYTSPIFNDPELLLFKYRLKGFSDDWTNAGDRRTAYFTNLSAGNYTFEVIAINSSGNVSHKAASISFKVKPYYYQNAWFQLTIIILTIGFILGGFFLRNWQILKRSKELELMVAEKTEDLNSTIDELKISNQNNERMLSIIGHDLRGPVGNIEQLLSLSLSESTDTKTKDEFIQLARSSATTSYNLLNSLLQWSREDKGLASFNPKKTVLEAEAQSVMDLYRFQADEKHISLVNKVMNDIVVYADVYMLSTILRNTISNALKFTQKNGEVSIDAKMEEGGTTIIISDDGTGMSKEQVTNLFSKTVISTKGTNAEVGTGLGLLLVHDLVIRHSGKAWAESEEGKGTSIFIFLPKKQE